MDHRASERGVEEREEHAAVDALGAAHVTPLELELDHERAVLHADRAEAQRLGELELAHQMRSLTPRTKSGSIASALESARISASLGEGSGRLAAASTAGSKVASLELFRNLSEPV